RIFSSSSLLLRPPPRSTLFPYTTLCRSVARRTLARRPPRRRPGLGRRPPRTRHHLTAHGCSRPVPHGRLWVHPDLRRSSFAARRSEEHTSELQSRENLVCRLLLEKTK